MRNTIIGVLLLLGAGSILWFIFLAPASHTTPEVLGLGSAFEGDLQLPADKIRAVFETARGNMLAVNQHGVWLRFGAIVAAVSSFLFTAAITIIVAVRRDHAAAGSKTTPPEKEGGEAPKSTAEGGGAPPAPPDPTTAVPMSGISKRVATLIAVLAAVASILGGVGNSLLAASQDRFKRADEIHDLLARARKEVIDAQSADEALDVLDDLLLKSSR